MNPHIQRLLEELVQQIAAQTALSEHETRDALGLEDATVNQSYESKGIGLPSNGNYVTPLRF